MCCYSHRVGQVDDFVVPFLGLLSEAHEVPNGIGGTFYPFVLSIVVLDIMVDNVATRMAIRKIGLLVAFVWLLQMGTAVDRGVPSTSLRYLHQIH